MKLKLILTTAIVGAALALPGVSSAGAQAPGVEFNVDPFGHFDNKTGDATLTGTLVCPSGAFGFVFRPLLSQPRDEWTQVGVSGFFTVSCNGATQQWSLIFTPFDFPNGPFPPFEGKFTGGPADLSTDFAVFVPDGNPIDLPVNERVILRGGG
jgi:hypothetical protein